MIALPASTSARIVFKKVCRTLFQTQDPTADTKPLGHVALDCKNPKALDKANVAEKSEEEAWALLKQASDERDIGDFKEAVQILSKACPDYTYPKLEKEFRARNYSIYLIAMEKDHGELATWTNVNLQGDVGKKFAVSYFTSDKAQRPTLLDKWPASPEENLTRLEDAGIPLNRGVDKCSNCNKLGHTTRRCPDEKMASVQPVVTCFLCGEEGHRVRDCGQERKPAGRACKVCESEEHLAKVCLNPSSLKSSPDLSSQDRPNKEKRACRVCGDEEHMAADCPNKEKRTCRNCGEEDHMAKECPNPRKVTCNICSEEGHIARVSCSHSLTSCQDLTLFPHRIVLERPNFHTRRSIGPKSPVATARRKVMVVLVALRLPRTQLLVMLAWTRSMVVPLLLVVGKRLPMLVVLLLSGKLRSPMMPLVVVVPAVAGKHPCLVNVRVTK
jgi:hypothetical protein